MEKAAINDHKYQARRVLVLGTTGTGKTTLATRLIYSHPAPLVLVYDWQGGEFAERLGAKLAHSRHELAAAIKSGDRICCYAGAGDQATPEEVATDFDWFCSMAFELAGETPGRKLIVIDECQDLIDPWNLPPALGSLLSKGRRRLVDTCMIGSAANALQSTARNQVTELYCFRSVDENALKYPGSLGIDTDTIRDLPNTHLVYRDNVSGDQKRLALWGGEE